MIHSLIGVLCAMLALPGAPAAHAELPPGPATGSGPVFYAGRAAIERSQPEPDRGHAAADEELIYLAGELSEQTLAKLEAASPRVRIIAGLNRQTALEHAARADAIDARLLTPALLEQAPRLRWVHAMSAGVDRLMAVGPLRESDRITLTNSRAAHGPAIADHAMGMLLTLTRNLRYYDRAQSEGRWSREDPPARSVALQDRTMLIVGLGGIGTEIASRAHAFGMKVIATRRTEAPSPGFIARTGRPQDLMAMLPEADVVAVCVPLTAETEGLFGEEQFKSMKPGAILINIARGRVVDTDALLAALRSGRLRGAGLDVTDPEPLPPDHPLWREASVIITPHVAADAELTEDRVLAILEENIRRFGAGEALANIVDKRAGY